MEKTDKEIEQMLQETYNVIAKDYIKETEGDWEDKTNLDQFLSYLPKGSHILDVGCGAGVVSEYCCEKGYQVTGIDNAKEMLKITKERCSKVITQNRSIYDLENYHQTFDGIIMTYIIVNISKTKIKTVLGSILNKLKKDGILIMVFTTNMPEGIQIEPLNHAYRNYWNNYTVEEVGKLLKEERIETLMQKEGNVQGLEMGMIIGKKK